MHPAERDKGSRARRYIAEYAAQTEELLAQYELRTFEIAAFRREFLIPDSDPMLDCYPIKPGNTPFLEKYLTQLPDWNFSRSLYFVEASAE